MSLSAEGEELRDEIEGWAARLKIPWSVGYGAAETLTALEVPGYPTTFVIGRDGKVAWHTFQGGALDRAIQDALN